MQNFSFFYYRVFRKKWERDKRERKKWERESPHETVLCCLKGGVFEVLQGNLHEDIKKFSV